MADESKGKRLLGAAAGAAATGATFGAVGALSRRAEEKRATALRRERVQVEAQRAAQRGPKKVAAQRADASKNLTGKMTPKQSKEFREYAKRKRLSARAQKARSRMAKAGSKSLGAAGIALNAPGTIGAARSIEAEGGPYAARFGKFVERILGAAPSQYLPRPPTERERTIQY